MNLYSLYLVLQVIESLLVIALVIATMIVLLKLNKLFHSLSHRVQSGLQSIETKIGDLSNSFPFNLFKRSNNG